MPQDRAAITDAFAWVEEATVKLENEFGNRLAFVGLQGSRARGEEQPSSDIDLVVLITHLSSADLATYRSIIQSLPHAEFACGFVGSPEVLETWPRHELFQFVNDTIPFFGKLPFAPSDFTRADAREAARIGASGIYHAVCHAAVFDGEAEDGVLREAAKGAVFVLQSLHFSRTGTYLRKKLELETYLSGDDAEVLAWSSRAKTSSRLVAAEVRHLSDLLLRWSEVILTS